MDTIDIYDDVVTDYVANGVADQLEALLPQLTAGHWRELCGHEPGEGGTVVLTWESSDPEAVGAAAIALVSFDTHKPTLGSLMFARPDAVRSAIASYSASTPEGASS